MKLVPVENQVSPRKHAYCKVQKLLEQFMESNMDVALVHLEEGEYSSAQCAQRVLNRTADRIRVGCRAFVRNGCLYVIREERDGSQASNL